MPDKPNNSSLRWYVAAPVAHQGWVRDGKEADAVVSQAGPATVLIAYAQNGAHAAQTVIQLRAGEWSIPALERVLRSAVNAAAAIVDVAPFEARMALGRIYVVATAARLDVVARLAQEARSRTPRREDRLLRGCIVAASSASVYTCTQCGSLAVQFVGAIDANTLFPAPEPEERRSIRCPDCGSNGVPASVSPADCGSCRRCASEVAFSYHDCAAGN